MRKWTVGIAVAINNCLKQVLIVLLRNAVQQVWVWLVLEDDHYKHISFVKLSRERIWTVLISCASNTCIYLQSFNWQQIHTAKNLKDFIRKKKCPYAVITCQHMLAFEKHMMLNEYWLHERVTWKIVTPRKRGKASVDSGFLGVTISHVTLWCNQ